MGCDADPSSHHSSRAETFKEQHEWDIFPVDTRRQMPTMEKVQHTKVVNTVKILSDAVHR